MDVSALAAQCLAQQRPFMEYLLTLLDGQFKAYDEACRAEEGRAFLQKRLNEQRRDASKVKSQFQTMARCLQVLSGQAPNPSPDYVARHQLMRHVMQLTATMPLEALSEIECLIQGPVEEAAFQELKALGQYDRILKDVTRHCHDHFPKGEDGAPAAEFEAWHQSLQAQLAGVIAAAENSLAEFAARQLDLWAKRKNAA